MTTPRASLSRPLGLAALLGMAALFSGCEGGPGTSPAPEAATSPVAPEIAARLEEAKNDVKVRRGQDLVWRKAEEKTDLTSHDAVRTGPDSTGVLRYSDNTLIDVAENSLVIVLDRQVRKNVEETVVALPEGTIEGRLQDAGGRTAELTVRTRQGWVKVANKSLSGKAVFRTTVTKTGALEVRSDRGELKVMTEGRERTVGQNQVLTLPGAAAGTTGPAAESFEQLPKATEAAWSASQVRKVEPRALDESGRPIAALKDLKNSEDYALDLFFLSEPRENAVITGRTVRVSGEIAGRLRAYLREKELKPGSQGRFSLEVELQPGENVMQFKIVGPSNADVRYETRRVVRK